MIMIYNKQVYYQVKPKPKQSEQKSMYHQFF